MAEPTPASRIPDLERLIDDKLAAVAACIGRARGMGDFAALTDDQQESLLDDAFELLETPEGAAPPLTGELERLLREHRALTQEMAAIHKEADSHDFDTN